MQQVKNLYKLVDIVLQIYNIKSSDSSQMAEEQQMGQLALVIGDFHIPQRCSEIPPKYRQMITPNKVSAVFCTGNLGSRQVYDWVKTLSGNLTFAKGDYQDEAQNDFAQQKVVQFAGSKVGVIHGHQIIPWADEQAMYNKAKKMGVQLLIIGHTHQMKVSSHNGVHFINPGSMTGAYSTLSMNANPTFMILQFKSTQIVVYEYSLVQGQLNCVDTRIPKTNSG